MKVYLNLGSNLGNRLENISRAVALISESPEIVAGSLKLTDAIESEPWGFDSSHRFMNVGVSFEIEKIETLEDILRFTQAIERKINGSNCHRDSNGNYADRLLDIDIIAVDDLEYQSDILTVPHPAMHLREFVLAPMAQLNAEWKHPRYNLTAAELLEQLRTRG